MNKNIVSALFLLVGIIAGYLLAKFGGWDLAEPVIGITTLTVSLGIWLRSRMLERKLESSMEQKSFQITFGLRRGYEGEDADFTADDVDELIQKWMESRVKAGLTILTGMVQGNLRMHYPVRNDADGSRVTTELSGRYFGSLSPKYDKGRSEAEVIETLNDLATYIGLGLEQKRIYLSFAGRQWALDL